MPRWRNKSDTWKVVKNDVITKMPVSWYHIEHKEWIDQFVVYLWMFRVPVFIYVWDIWEEKTKEFFKKERERYWAEWEFEYNVWWNTISQSWFGHLIWLKNYNITTLVHELCHITQTRLEYCWMKHDDEVQAYFLQWLLDMILSMDKDRKFKFIEPLPLDD